MEVKFTPRTIEPTSWDNFFTGCYITHLQFKLIIDLTHLDNTPSVADIFKIKSVLEKHRQNTKLYLQETTVILKNKTLAKTLHYALPLIKPEKPVYII